MTDFDAQPDRPVPLDPTVEERTSDAADVDAALRGLAAVVMDVAQVEDVLDHIATLAKRGVPGAQGVGVTLVPALGRPLEALTWSVTDAFVREIDRLQYEVCAEGPCLTAMDTLRPLTSGSLGSDTRWRRFGSRVARMGVFSALALPLVTEGTVVGAINIYSHERDAFGEHAVALGESFAQSAAISVQNTRMLHAAREHAAQLQVALNSRAVIDQAIGILRSRSGGSAEQAFTRLSAISQAENVKLSVVAHRIVDEAVRRADARHRDAD